MPEERKLATILFADIVGSTTLAGEHDPERIRAVFRRTFEHLRGVIEGHGGSVEKFIGDEVMAVFGVPTAHDDDAQRAVRCALAIRAATTAFEPASRLGVTLRIGLNTGEVIANLDGGDQNLVTGQAVNAAARLRAAASPGEILVGALTKRLTDRGITYGPPRSIEAKNIGALESWPAEAVATATPEQDRGLPGLRAPLIGRDDELRLLTDAFRRLAGEPRPYLVTIFGPPGAGKTRLSEEFLATLTDATVRRGRCLPYGEAITFYALQAMLREDLGVGPDDSREGALAALDRRVAAAFADDADADAVKRRVAVTAGLLPAEEALADVAQGELGDELRWGIRRYWERRAAAGPLVLVFEDIHWAEPRLLEIIEDLAEWSRAPLLVLCLARPDLRDSRPNWGGGATNATAIALSPLNGEESRTLISELLAIDDLSEELRSEVVTRAGGNPLYVEEFLRMLMDSGRIAQRDGRWVAVAGLELVEVPPTLQGIITARLDRVSPAVKALLQCASLPGRLCSTDALTALRGEAPKAEHLREAVRRDLLIEADERPSVGAGRVYRFKHVLIRDVAYSTLPKAERSTLHDRYGRWLEDSLGERRAEGGDVIAFHAEQAALLAREVDHEQAPALGRRAFDLLLDAAWLAWKRDDTHAGLNLFDRCIGAAATIDVSAEERLRASGPAALLHWFHEGESWLPRVDELIDEGRGIGPSTTLALLLMFRAGNFLGKDLESAKSLFAEALAVARAAGDPEVISQVWRQSAHPAQWVGNLDEAERVLRDASEYERGTGTFAQRANPLCDLAWLKIRRGRFTDAAAYLEEATPLVEASRSRFQRNYWLFVLSWLAGEVGDFGRAIARAVERANAAAETGMPGSIANSEWALGQLLLRAGQHERAGMAIERSLELFPRTNRGQRPTVLAHLAEIRLTQGQVTEAQALVKEAEETMLPWDVEAQVMVGTAGALAAARGQDPVGAEGRFRKTIDNCATTQFDLGTAGARIAFARFLLSQDRFADARDQLKAALPAFSDPLAYRRRDEIDSLLRQCEAVRR